MEVGFLWDVGDDMYFVTINTLTLPSSTLPSRLKPQSLSILPFIVPQYSHLLFHNKNYQVPHSRFSNVLKCEFEEKSEIASILLGEMGIGLRFLFDMMMIGKGGRFGRDDSKMNLCDE